MTLIILLHNSLSLSFISKYNKLEEALFGMPWYLLPLKHQKTLATAMNRVQNGTTLTIGPFDELNFETATNV